MEKRNSTDFSVPSRLLALLASAFMCGFIGAVSPDFYSAPISGMLFFSAMLTMLVFAFFGSRRKMSYEALPVAVILASVCGLFNLFIGQPVSLWQAPLFGFGTMPLFTMYISSLFSKKRYGVRRFILLFFVYAAVILAFKALTVPRILDLIDLEPLRRFNAFFGTDAVLCIARCAACVICSVIILAAFRDGVTALLSLALNLIFSVCSLGAFAVRNIGIYAANFTLPAVIISNAEMLSYFVGGFLAGFLTMLLLICLPRRITASENRFTCEEPFKSRFVHCLYSALLTFDFTFVFTLAYPLSKRLIPSDKAVFSVPLRAVVTVGVCLVAFVIFLGIFRKNIVSKGMPVPVALRPRAFCAKALPIYFLAYAAVALFTGNAPALQIEYGKIISSPTYENTLGSSEFVLFSVLAISAAAFLLFYVISVSSRRKK